MSRDRDDPEFRVPVPQALQPQIRLYRRLWLARVDLEEAKAALEELWERRIPVPKDDRPPPLLLSLTTALVVAYARPWVHSRGQSVADKTVPGSFLRALTAKQREVHDLLIDVRNREIAHSDADVADLHLRLLVDGDAAILRTSREPFTRQGLRIIRSNIIKLTKAFDRRCAELRRELPRNTWI